ncbi:MAG: YdcF family protein [Lachnospiraceae bacterium]
MYFIFIVIYVGPRLSFHYVWLAAGAVFLCVSRSLKTGSWLLIPGPLRAVLIISVLVCMAVFILMEVLVLSKMGAVPEKPVQYVIVLGACVRGTRVTRSLAFRLKKAAEYARAHPDCMLVVSGGQGPGEDITEAQAMSGWLEAHGIGRERILLEDRSVNTRENLLFSKEVICRYEAGKKADIAEDVCTEKMPYDCGCREENLSIAVCSNNFHMYRAMSLARAAGKWHTEGLAAMTDPFMWLSFTVREGAALFKEVIFGHVHF